MAVNISISGTRALNVTGRLVAGESVQLNVTGGTPAALYLVDEKRAVVAACQQFEGGAGTINLATVPIGRIFSTVPAGRAVSLACLVEGESGGIIGYGFIPVVSAPMPDDLDPLDDDYIYAKLSDLQAYLTRAEADARYAPIDVATPVAPSTDSSAAGKPADAKATGDQLAGKVQSVNGVTPTAGAVTLCAHDVGALSMSEAVAGYTDWAVDPPTYGGHALEIYHDPVLGKYMLADAVTGGVLDATADGSYPTDDATSLSFAIDTGYTATRTRLRPTEAQEATWNAKQEALTSAQLANIAAVPSKADAADLRYAQGETITASAQLADRTGNRVVPLATNTENIGLTFPDAVAGYLRDFLVLVTNTAGNTGSITFTPPTGATVYGDGFTHSPASGETWLYSVTEVAANVFWAKSEKMEVAQ